MVCRQHTFDISTHPFKWAVMHPELKLMIEYVLHIDVVERSMMTEPDMT